MAPSGSHNTVVARMVRQVEAELTEALDHALASFDISAAQYAILSAVSSGRAETAAAIGKDLSYSPGATKRVLAQLEDKGMVVRSREPGNRGEVKVELTETARRIFPTLRAAAVKVIDRFFGEFDSGELTELETLLKTMLGHH